MKIFFPIYDLPGTGWGVKVLEGDGTLIDHLMTRDLRRGGIYVGDDDIADNDNFSDDVEISYCILDGADEESPLRINNGRNLKLHHNTLINTRSRSKKEAVQLRGGSGIAYLNHVIGSVAGGQTPVGRPILANFRLTDNVIYGYVLCQAGADFEIIGGEQWMTPNYEFQGVKYSLANGGGGYALSAKPATLMLPAAKLIAKNSTIVGAKYLTAGKAKTVNVTTHAK